MGEQVNTACANHCEHSLDWMRYDQDLEVTRCAYPVGHACDYCGGLECGHQCDLVTVTQPALVK